VRSYFRRRTASRPISTSTPATLDGKVKKLFTETSPAWVGVNDNPFFLRDGNAIWESERDGWNHLYLYGSNGQLIRRLTSGKWEVRTVYGIDPADQWVYFTATKDSPIAENIYRVKIADGTIERLSQGTGNHSPAFNSNFTHFVDTWSDINTPPQARLYDSAGQLVRVVNENKPETLAQYKLGKTEFLNVRTRDGFEMEAIMIKPPDFDPSKKYPVLSYTYSGPHAPSVVDRWGGNRYMWHQLMAQKGYITWVCDNRTASGKGLESTWPVYKNFGPLELRDLEDGVAYLKTLPYVDGTRHRPVGMELWRVYDELCVDAQQCVQNGHRRRNGLGLAQLRLDLHRTLYAHAAAQSRGLRQNFGPKSRQKPLGQTAAHPRRH
jgi:dipeptidyl-peptidase-4